MNLSRAATFLLLPLLLLGFGCRRHKTVVDPHVTGINLTVRYQSGLQLSALAISGTVDGAAAFPLTTLPDPPRALKSGQETVAILLPSSLDGKTVAVRVDGRSQTKVAGSDQQVAVIQAERMVSLIVTLGPPAVCGDRATRDGLETCDDGNTTPGDGCSATCQIEDDGSCNPTSCPSGCCAAGGICQPRNATACGAPGKACAACPALVADGCSLAGVCSCGGAAACATGQHCVGGACVCDHASCKDGCCAENKCLAGDAVAACGTAGNNCEECTTGGCIGGTCNSCGPTTCPNGCCSGPKCIPRSASSCGTGGAACVACDSDRADTCGVNGACRCGGKAPCRVGQRCMNGACVCDVTSCPAGCCDGAGCSAQSLATCGPRGGTCSDCDTDRADRCGPNGVCRCGTALACAGGQRCLGAQCICDTTSCPSGCCQDGKCNPRTVQTCGDAGSTCVSCDSRADNCSAAGACRCGTGATCALGQRCIGSTCVCDGTSCPTGCCAAGVCLPGESPASCGSGGSACEMCPGGETCTDGGRCSGCNSTTCPNGCCSGATCYPSSVSKCGTKGALCVGCDATKADGCSSAGGCACGTGAACAAGQKCAGGQCVCDATSCPNGCCKNNACIARSLQQCGAAGSACVACSDTTADSCTETGACACGGGAACAAGQRCTGANCVCDIVSCAGCCTANTCRGLTLATCGPPGSACGACGITSDRCSGRGLCQCGTADPCGVGQRCVGGACVCDATSCPNGCCSAGACLPGTTDTSCGNGGSACEDCRGMGCSGGACANCTATNCASGCCSGSTCTTGGTAACGAGGAACVTCDVTRADSCSMSGECRCGANAACGAGTNCVAGVCACTATSCPTGCCAAGVCTAQSLATCGMGGRSCTTCNPTLADGCDTLTGACRCGTTAACPAGTACLNGACICNASSCPNGCCSAGRCLSPMVSACGTGGGTCVACDPNTADACSTSGTCQCGTGASCTEGESCSLGTCQ